MLRFWKFLALRRMNKKSLSKIRYISVTTMWTDKDIKMCVSRHIHTELTRSLFCAKIGLICISVLFLWLK